VLYNHGNCWRWKINPIDFDTFIAFCRTKVGQELSTIGGKEKFTFQNITDRAFYYGMPAGDTRKQNIRYVKRVLEQYAKLQSLNPGHYANITQNGAYILALIQMFEDQRLNHPEQPWKAESQA
jgi:hypothetical protein